MKSLKNFIPALLMGFLLLASCSSTPKAKTDASTPTPTPTPPSVTCANHEVYDVTNQDIGACLTDDPNFIKVQTKTSANYIIVLPKNSSDIISDSSHPEELVGPPSNSIYGLVSGAYVVIPEKDTSSDITDVLTSDAKKRAFYFSAVHINGSTQTFSGNIVANSTYTGHMGYTYTRETNYSYTLETIPSTSETGLQYNAYFGMAVTPFATITGLNALQGPFIIK